MGTCSIYLLGFDKGMIAMLLFAVAVLVLVLKPYIKRWLHERAEKD